MRPFQTLQEVLTLSLLLITHLAPSLAENRTGTIVGTIVDEEKGWPIRGATVYLLGASGEIRTQTDFKGKFSFTAPAGNYSGIAVLRPGGEEVYEIEADLPVVAGVEDDLTEIPIPRLPSQTSEATPFDPATAPPVPAPPAGTDPAPAPPPEPNLIPVLPPPSQSIRPIQPPSSGQSQKPEQGRAWLGVYMQDTALQSDPNGQPGPNTVIQVLKVFQGSPAERAQIFAGDVLVTLDGRRLTNVQDLQKRLLDYKPGMKPRFLLMREGGFLETVVTLEEITDSMMQSLQPPPDQPPPGQGQAPSPNPNSNPAGPQGPSAGPPTDSLPGGPPPQGFPPGSSSPQAPQAPQAPPGQSQVPPLIEEARQLAAQGRYLQASEKYDEHLLEFPNDGRAAAEQAEMVYFHIQNARGMALMSQAVKKQGLSVPEKTRLRMIIAQRRFESGNLVTAKQMLIEALREDPGNPNVNGLLDIIYQIEAAARAQQQAPYYGPGHPKTELELRLEEEFSEALEDLFD